MKSNLRLHVMPVVTNMAEFMIHANDKGRHDIAYSRQSQRWMLENEKDGLIRSHYSLVSALSDLERVSGMGASQFGLSPNPY